MRGYQNTSEMLGLRACLLLDALTKTSNKEDLLTFFFCYSAFPKATENAEG